MARTSRNSAATVHGAGNRKRRFWSAPRLLHQETYEKMPRRGGEGEDGLAEGRGKAAGSASGHGGSVSGIAGASGGKPLRNRGRFRCAQTVEAADYRGALHRVKGCGNGYKTCERVEPVVASRGDTYLAGSLFEMFRLPRVLLNEVVGCGDLAVFLRNGLILHDLPS